MHLSVSAIGTWLWSLVTGRAMAIAAPTTAPTEEPAMPDAPNNQAINADGTIAGALIITEKSAEAVAEKLKAVLIALGHDVEQVWDEAVALAKKAA